MNSIKPAAVVIAVFLLLGSAVSQAQTTDLYRATTLPANPQLGVVHYLQTLTLAQGPGTYTLNSFQLGVNFNTGATDQGVIVLFYTGVDTSPTSTDALAGATFLGGVQGVLGAPGSAGNFTYTFTLNTPMSIPSNILGVEFSLTDDTFANYSTEINGRFTANGPTVGSAPGFVYNDGNLDNKFTGAEQTKFSMTNAYVRFSMIGSAPVPEPSTWVMLAGGLGILFLGMRARRVS